MAVDRPTHGALLGDWMEGWALNARSVVEEDDVCCSLMIDIILWLVLSVCGRHHVNYCPRYHVRIMAFLELAGMLPITPQVSQYANRNLSHVTL